MLNISDLTLIYPDKTVALEDFSLELREGESLALIGGNGAGKSSLLFSFVGILDSAKGIIELEGKRLTKESKTFFREKIGMVFQNPDDQLFTSRIYDDIAFGPRNEKLDEKTVKSQVEAVMDTLNIKHLQDRSPLRLSGGEKRVCAIATVLAMNPSIILFDEPTAFLDHKARRTLIDIINKLPVSKIIATHDLDFASKVCGRAVILSAGKKVAEGGIELLYNREKLEEYSLDCLKI